MIDKIKSIFKRLDDWICVSGNLRKVMWSLWILWVLIMCLFMFTENARAVDYLNKIEEERNVRNTQQIRTLY